jgi:hypothetical protein
VGWLSNNIQLFLFNFILKYYDQIEVMPIFQVLWIIFSMIFGMILLTEAQFYTWPQLLGIFATTLIGVAGMYVLVLKQTNNLATSPPKKPSSEIEC